MSVTVSKSFQEKARKSVFAIVLFVVVYLLLLLAAAGLTVLCVLGGIAIIAARPMFFTLVAGLGLASIGIMIFIFLVKFVFKKHQTDLSAFTEIDRSSQPDLFAFIDDIVAQVGTNFPKKIYISNQVNASVFYDSSFWSMFLPISKNLHIGMGLVNTVTEEELKAILSHEFGHFSQKSMQVGSYVYNVNQVIFNMLYDNDSYTKMVQSWANVSNYFILFVGIALKIVEGIQWILRKMYAIVNRSYMELSREMEFHADAVAASVTGYLPLKSSLLRMELADKSFEEVLGFYNSKFEEAWVSNNIFEEQLFVLQFLASKEGFPIVDGFPMVSEENNRFQSSRVVIENQWASHPATKDRIAALEKLQLVQPIVAVKSANSLFANVTQLQERLTQKIFVDVPYTKEKQVLRLQEFSESYEKIYVANSFSPIYNEYYDRRNPLPIPLEEVSEAAAVSISDLFGEEKISLVHSFLAMEQDAMLLQNIADTSGAVSTFDYEGVKFQKKDAPMLLASLTKEKDLLQAQLLANDQKIYQFFYAKASSKGLASTLQSYYEAFYAYDVVYEERFARYQKLIEQLQFTRESLPYDEIISRFRSFLLEEIPLKEQITAMLQDSLYQEIVEGSVRTNLELYLSKDWKYFSGEAYDETALSMLFDAINNFQYLNHRGYFLTKKRLLDFQAGL